MHMNKVPSYCTISLSPPSSLRFLLRNSSLQIYLTCHRNHNQSVICRLIKNNKNNDNTNSSSNNTKTSNTNDSSNDNNNKKAITNMTDNKSMKTKKTKKTIDLFVLFRTYDEQSAYIFTQAF